MTELSVVHRNPCNGNHQGMNFQVSEQSEGTDPLADYCELSIWPKKRQKHPKKAFTCKWWLWDFKRGSGTMPGLQRYIEDKPVLLVIVGFLRGCGMFYGLSNPIMGIFSLVAALVNSPFNFMYLTWTVGWSMLWSYAIDAPRELILNGLYPSQGILLGYAVYINFEPFDLKNLPNLTVVAIGFVALIPLTFFVVMLFQCLANITIKHLGVTPMFMSSMLIGQLWWLMTGYSNHFINYNIYPQMLEPARKPSFFNVTFETFYTEVIYGVSMLQFSNSFYCFVPITIGLFLTSPIACLTTWCGSFIGISTTVLLGMDFKYVRLGLYGINSCIVFSSIAGTFFVLNGPSIVLASLCTFCTVFLIIATKAFCTPYGIPYFGIPATLVVIMAYIALDNVPGLYRIPVIALTVPEDHLKRAKTNKLLGAEIPFYTKIVVGRNLSYKLRKNVDIVFNRVLLEKCILNGENRVVKQLLETKIKVRENGIYTSKPLIHIAVQAGNFEIFQILYNNYNDIPERVLETAIYFRQDAIIDYLLQDGVLLEQDNSSIAQNIIQSIHENNIESTQRWIKCGASLNTVDYIGYSPIEFARITQNAAALEVLKSENKTCEPNKENIYNVDNKDTNIEWDIVQYFGKKVTTSRNIYTDLTSESTEAAKHVTVEILKRNHEKQSEEDEEILFILICFIMRQKPRYFQKVINEIEGLNLSLKDQFLNSLLHKCCEFNLAEITKLLIARGADTEAKNLFGYRPLEITFDENESSVHTFREIMPYTINDGYHISYLMKLINGQNIIKS